MPLGAKNKGVEVWSAVLERSERKLTRWKRQYLSMGGRLTLIKSVMDALPTYMMSLLPIPGNIEKKINKVQTKESLLVAGEQREAWVQLSQMGGGDPQQNTRGYGD